MQRKSGGSDERHRRTRHKPRRERRAPFMSARSFQATTGVQRFYDQHDLGARELEPDSFFFNAAARMIAEHHEGLITNL